MRKVVGAILLSVFIICSIGGCGTTQLSGSGEEKKASAEMQTENTSEKKHEDPEKESEVKKEASEEEAYLDVDSAEDIDVDYSKYEEKNIPEAGNSGNDQDNTAGTEQDQYLTDPVPDGMAAPVEPEDAEIDTSSEGVCYLSISCATILDNMENLTEGKESLIPADGMILDEIEVSFYEGESVFDVLQRVTQNNRIHMESSFTPMYNSAYVEGINNIYEFDCGELSGWMFAVNGWYPNYGCSRYQVQDGDVIQWNYTCDQGRDL